jgi:phospholipid/cholesterol/gamma-HCH transport system substrate-binding protein
MTARLLTLLALAIGAVLLLAGCGGNDRTVALAEFDDVVDLTTNAAVKIADVDVGRISGIELNDAQQALVEMELDPDVELPSVVSARLRKTNVLGERFIELVPDRESGGRFESGSMVAETTIVPELEEMIFSGTDVLIAVSADTMAAAIEAGATGLDGRGDTLGQVLTDLGEIVSTYDRNSDDLVRLISGFEEFLAEVGPQADLHGRAVGELAAFTRTLSEEDERLIDTLTEIRALANSGTDIMQTHRRRIDDFFTRFTAVTDEIVARGDDLDRLFPMMYGHNYHVIRGVNAEHAQIVADFIVCGINDDPGDPVRACDDPPQGRARPVPRPPQDY